MVYQLRMAGGHKDHAEAIFPLGVLVFDRHAEAVIFKFVGRDRADLEANAQGSRVDLIDSFHRGMAGAGHRHGIRGRIQMPDEHLAVDELQIAQFELRDLPGFIEKSGVQRGGNSMAFALGRHRHIGGQYRSQSAERQDQQ